MYQIDFTSCTINDVLMRYAVEPYQHGYHVVDHGEPCLHTWSLHQHVAERWCTALNTAYASWVECSSVVWRR